MSDLNEQQFNQQEEPNSNDKTYFDIASGSNKSREEVEKGLSKAKIKFIIAAVCLALSAIGTISIYIVMSADYSTVLRGIAGIFLILGLCAEIITNAFIGIFTQLGKFIVGFGKIIPIIGLLLGLFLGFVGVIFLPVAFCISPFKSKLKGYRELKEVLEYWKKRYSKTLYLYLFERK